MPRTAIRIIPVVVLFPVVVLLTACTTTMNVQKAGSGVHGLRYSLPRPLLMVTPNADGTLSFEWKYFPDSSAEYAIETKSYLAKHKAVIDVDEAGLLKKVEWNPQSTDIAKALIEGSNAIVKAQLDQRAADAKTRNDALIAAKKAVDDAQAELDTINAELAVLETTDKEDMKLAARIKKAGIEIKLETAKKSLAALQGAGTTAPSSPNPGQGSGAGLQLAPTPGSGQATSGVDFPKAWGPLFFEIVEDPSAKTVTLKAVRPQEQFATYRVPEPPKAPAADVVFRAEGTGIAKRLKSGKPSIVILASAPIHELTEVRLLKGASGTDEVTNKFLFTVNLQPAGGIAVTLHKNTPQGIYRITFSYKRSADGDEKGPETIAIGVE